MWVPMDMWGRVIIRTDYVKNTLIEVKIDSI